MLMAEHLDGGSTRTWSVTGPEYLDLVEEDRKPSHSSRRFVRLPTITMVAHARALSSVSH